MEYFVIELEIRSGKPDSNVCSIIQCVCKIPYNTNSALSAAHLVTPDAKFRIRGLKYVMHRQLSLNKSAGPVMASAHNYCCFWPAQQAH